MKIAITGGGGTIGQILYNGLKNNYDVVTIDIKNAMVNTNLNNPIYLFDNVDIVIHLAGNKNNTDSFDKLLKPNIIMCQKVFDECKRANVKKVIFASSNHTQIQGFKLEGYGNPTQRLENVILSKDDPYYPDSFYGVTKIFGEMLGKYYSEVENAFDFVALRIGWVINPDDAPNTDYFNCMHLSNNDCIQCFKDAINSKERFSIKYGVSGNTIYKKE
jgi:nucleoside-diphosphate-sugar epimerase